MLELFKEHFELSEDGSLIRTKCRFKRFLGVTTGHPDTDGYMIVSVGNHPRKVHQIVWMLHHNKEIPAGMVIDHKNGIRDDNHPDNLRAVLAKDNGKNQKAHREGHLLGTSRRPNGRWWARATVQGKRISLGVYDTQQEAHKAYLNYENSIR